MNRGMKFGRPWLYSLCVCFFSSVWVNLFCWNVQFYLQTVEFNTFGENMHNRSIWKKNLLFGFAKNKLFWAFSSRPFTSLSFLSGKSFNIGFNYRQRLLILKIPHSLYVPLWECRYACYRHSGLDVYLWMEMFVMYVIKINTKYREIQTYIFIMM